MPYGNEYVYRLIHRVSEKRTQLFATYAQGVCERFAQTVTALCCKNIGRYRL